MNPRISFQPHDMFVQHGKINVELEFCREGEDLWRLQFYFSAISCFTAA